MADLLNAFRTTAGNEFQKKEDTAGRTYYVQKGEGRISAKAFSGANQSLSHVVTDSDGRMPREIREADTAEALEGATEIPFTNDFLMSVEGRADESKSQALRAEGNRFLAFWDKNDHMDRDRAAKEYIEFRNELKGVDDPEARAIIKSRYNIGGS